MIWQDIIIMIANLMFTYALIPQVYHGFKNKKAAMIFQTALITTVGLFVTSFAFLTLSLFFSAAVSFINATLWLLLLIQKIRYN
jgi:hypothetical protein